MSTAGAATLEPPPRPAIASADLLRLEGLGDNCEFGFFLRRLGFDDGMLFRWALMKPESLLATLRGDFAHLYDFENLVPVRRGMVRDLHYGTAWHTQMYSTLRDGTFAFNDQAEMRRLMHGKEAAKLAYLLEKLRRKFDHPNPVFVIKANKGIPEQILEAIHYQIYRRATSPRLLLLEVRADAGRAGRVERLDRNLMRGYVSRFAPYERPEDADDASWLSIITQALAGNAGACVADAALVEAGTPSRQPVVLPFPAGQGPDLLVPVPGDLRAGMPARIGGNAWCRKLDEETYRLHAIGQHEAATTLRWTGVHLAPNSLLTVAAWCAISESLPVQVTLQVTGADGMEKHSRHVFDQVREEQVTLLVPPALRNPLTISLHAETLMPLRNGERAVIDIDPIRAVPLGG
jgi:hypothetical protein